MFNIDTNDIKKLVQNLKNCNKSAFPLSIRSTLNRFAYETSNIAKTKILPGVFTLRNKYIQGSVGYQRCQNTFNISSMESFAGQRSEHLGKPSSQLAKQEEGSSIVAKGKHTFVPTSDARGGSNNKPVKKKNYLGNLKVYKLSRLVRTPTSEPRKEIPQAIGYAERHHETFAVIAHSPWYLKYGIFRILPTGKSHRAKMLYKLTDRTTSIKQHQWLKPATDNVLSRALSIYIEEAKKRIEKVLSKGCSRC